MSNIIKRDTTRPATLGAVVDQLFNQNLNRFFDDDYWGYPSLQMRSQVPVNVRETDKTYELELIAPGLNKQDFQLQFTGDSLTVSFEHKEESRTQGQNSKTQDQNSRTQDQNSKTQDQNSQSPQNNNRWLRQEYRQQSFTRTFNLDETVDAEKATARYDNGVLHISLPKKTQTQKISRSINVQ